MRALIDGDLVAYRCAASAENDDVEIALLRTGKLMEEIISSVSASSIDCYLSGGNNFRHEINPEYKANRKEVVRPQYLQACREFLVMYFNAQHCAGYEADDALGMEQGHNTIICSLDKDLKQIPGQHYNWVRKEHTHVSYDEGLLNFYTQTLVGDTSDNVFGIKGIGPVKAAKILNPLEPEEYYQACRELYNDDERYHSNCKLLWIWRHLGDIWQPPYIHSGSEDASRGEEDVPCTNDSLSEGDEADHYRGCTDSENYLDRTTESIPT